MADIAIIGAGISGLSAARMLSQKHQVKVYERGSRPGGLVKCDRIRDNLFHRVGGHVFNSKNPEVLQWFWSFFDRDKEFLKARRNAKILFQGKLIGYPIENYLHQLDKDFVSLVLDDFLSEAYQPEDPFSYPNFAEFLQSNFGKTLYESYFRPYNEKIWNTDLSEIPLNWLQGKLPMPDLKSMLLSNIAVQEESDMVHSTFFYAREGGSQFIADRLAEGLDIRFNSEAAEIQRKSEGFFIGEEGPFNLIVYTGDIRKAASVFPSSPAAKKASEVLQNLPSNGTSNLFCETDPGDVSWLYLPGPDTSAHRIIYTGTFAESNNRGSQRHTCVVEFSGNYSYEFMCEEVKKLPGNLQPLDWNHEPNSYILHNHESAAQLAEARKELQSEGIHLLGRFAEWEYYNMDKAIEAAMALEKEVDSIFF
jgi:protoporphyrinogen oxidase